MRWREVLVQTSLEMQRKLLGQNESKGEGRQGNFGASVSSVFSDVSSCFPSTIITPIAPPVSQQDTWKAPYFLWLFPQAATSICLNFPCLYHHLGFLSCTTTPTRSWKLPDFPTTFHPNIQTATLTNVTFFDSVPGKRCVLHMLTRSFVLTRPCWWSLVPFRTQPQMSCPGRGIPQHPIHKTPSPRFVFFNLVLYNILYYLRILCYVQIPIFCDHFLHFTKKFAQLLHVLYYSKFPLVYPIFFSQVYSLKYMPCDLQEIWPILRSYICELKDNLKSTPGILN